MSEYDPIPIFPIEPALDCWYLSGATASGKTATGLELAQRLNAEIISLDSMALFIGMDIGTAKPTQAERQVLPYHLVDLINPDQDFSLANYVEAAHAKIQEIRGRGREVLFVGGTPLYMKSLLRGIYQGPPANWEFRREVEREAQEVGVAALYERLALVDPLTAAKLHPNDHRRIIRALEVYKLTGRPISHLQTQFDEGHAAEECKVFVLEWPRADLHRRIEERVDQMFASGLVDEVRSLITRYGKFSRTATQAVGYGEVLAHLGGEQGLPETIELVKARTRQFARRQETWFRSLSECRRIVQQEGRTPAENAETILALGTAGRQS